MLFFAPETLALPCWSHKLIVESPNFIVGRHDALSQKLNGLRIPPIAFPGEIPHLTIKQTTTSLPQTT